MNLFTYIQDLLLSHQVSKPNMLRKTNYTTTFKLSEELPYGVWEYLVKRRAEFKCEDCGENNNLQSHHIVRPEDGGKNILRNGKCLCTQCHPNYRIPYRINGRLHKSLCRQHGYERGTEITILLNHTKTTKEKIRILNELTQEDQHQFNRKMGRRREKFEQILRGEDKEFEKIRIRSENDTPDSYIDRIKKYLNSLE